MGRNRMFLGFRNREIVLKENLKFELNFKFNQQKFDTLLLDLL